MGSNPVALLERVGVKDEAVFLISIGSLLGVLAYVFSHPSLLGTVFLVLATVFYAYKFLTVKFSGKLGLIEQLYFVFSGFFLYLSIILVFDGIFGLKLYSLAVGAFGALIGFGVLGYATAQVLSRHGYRIG